MNIFAQGREQSLEDVLSRREERFAYIKKLVEEYGHTVVCYKLNIPGPIKNNPHIAKIFAQGQRAILRAIGEDLLLYRDEKRSDAGDEAYFVLEGKAADIKRKMCAIEEEHVFGRLFDIDVLSEQGAVSRTELGFAERKCLICEKRAVECARSRSHSVEELREKIGMIFERYAQDERMPEEE